jgi:hypothetical protein
MNHHRNVSQKSRACSQIANDARLLSVVDDVDEVRESAIMATCNVVAGCLQNLRNSHNKPKLITTMKTIIAVLVLALVPLASAFSGSSFSGSSLGVAVKNAGNGMTMEYIPSGMSKEQWKKMKEKDQKKGKGNLGKTGITTFKSRSFSDWQKAGGINLFPVDPKSVKDPKDLPYM